MSILSILVGMVTLINLREVFFCFLFGCPEAIDLLGQPCRGWTVRKVVGKCWDNWSSRGLNLLPEEQRSKQMAFVLRLGSCQWNWVVTGATAAFDWSLLVPIRPPCKSTKSRLPDPEITMGRRFFFCSNPNLISQRKSSTSQPNN